MRKKLTCAIICILAMTAVIVSALAAEFTGRIWTGSPKRTLGIIYGYYCTAAQNTSSQGTDRWAHAWSKQNGAIIAEDYATGTVRAIANSQLVRPTSGYGEYGEEYGYAEQKFGAGAYLDY